jgi:hypothetical protein
MFTLATDVQKIIMEFLDPPEIKVLYETCKDAKIMFEELTKHTNFIIVCNIVVSDNVIKWFELKNIKLKLLEKYIITSSETQAWYKNGKYHRDNDLPAIIQSNGDKYWYKDGLMHRDNDLPAVVLSNGNKFWYQYGKYHRDNDLPAIALLNGNQHWYQNGKLHRENNMPAVIWPDGTQFYYKNGMFCNRSNIYF